MKRYLLIGMLIAAGSPVHAADCVVDVNIVTGVAMPSMLQAPRLKVSAMFHEIGIDVRINMGRPVPGAVDGCGAPIVILFDESTGYSGTRDALAYSILHKESGASIHIFLDRMMRHQRDPSFASTLLAHVMVHEITHVLEQSSQHALEGVMKARWSRADYERMKWHSLPFAPEDVEGIREGIARRITQAARSNTIS